jgi:hypothetical protein
MGQACEARAAEAVHGEFEVREVNESNYNF